ncbi:hypothetical protein D9M71_787260 [compost metagenome]
MGNRELGGRIVQTQLGLFLLSRLVDGGQSACQHAGGQSFREREGDSGHSLLGMDGGYPPLFRSVTAENRQDLRFLLAENETFFTVSPFGWPYMARSR